MVIIWTFRPELLYVLNRVKKKKSSLLQIGGTKTGIWSERPDLKSSESQQRSSS